jgi:hypothetical protein
MKRSNKLPSIGPSEPKLPTRAKKKRETKVSVNDLLLKAISNTSSVVSTFVPEEKINRTDSFPSSRVLRRESFESTVGSIGDLSISSRSTTNSMFGNLSQRAFQIDSTLPNGEQFRCERTIHEMISAIETCARSRRPAPAYVARLEQLGPELLSWDGVTDRKGARGKLSINIIGCQQPVELVLAMADRRCRKMKKMVEMKEKVCEDQRKQIDAVIEAKHTRAEIHANNLIRQQVQVQWLKVLVMCLAIFRLRPLYVMKVATHRVQNRKLSAKELVYRTVLSWYRYFTYKRYNITFLKSIAKYRMR